MKKKQQIKIWINLFILISRYLEGKLTSADEIYEKTCFCNKVNALFEHIIRNLYLPALCHQKVSVHMDDIFKEKRQT